MERKRPYKRANVLAGKGCAIRNTMVRMMLDALDSNEEVQ